MWGPMRAQARRAPPAGADVDRARVPDPGVIQFILGHRAPSRSTSTTPRRVEFLGLPIGAHGADRRSSSASSVLVATGLMLRITLLGKRMRALSDDLDLAETPASTPRG